MELHLIDACATLLGPQARKGGQSFLHQLDVSVIRQAYRRLAVASHPDAAVRQGAKPGSADGKRFLTVAPLGREEMTPTTVVLNWYAELGR